MEILLQAIAFTALVLAVLNLDARFREHLKDHEDSSTDDGGEVK
jgi:hypothetical protein